jgi:hypothetical protein
VYASARIGELSVAPGLCLELGPLAALNCGRLAIWSWRSRAAEARSFRVGGEEEGPRGAQHYVKKRIAHLHLARGGRRQRVGAHRAHQVFDTALMCGHSGASFETVKSDRFRFQISTAHDANDRNSSHATDFDVQISDFEATNQSNYVIQISKREFEV